MVGWTSWLGQWRFKVICWFPSWRSLQILKRITYSNHPKKGHFEPPGIKTPIGQRLRFPSTQDMSFSALRPQNSRPRPPANCPCAPSKRPRSSLPRSTGRVGQQWSRKIHEGFKGFWGSWFWKKKNIFMWAAHVTFNDLSNGSMISPFPISPDTLFFGCRLWLYINKPPYLSWSWWGPLILRFFFDRSSRWAQKPKYKWRVMWPL